MTPSISMEAGGPASRLSVSQPSRKGGFAPFRKAGLAALLLSVTALGGCAHNFIPPDINYDSAMPAKLTVDPPATGQDRRTAEAPAAARPVEANRRWKADTGSR